MHKQDKYAPTDYLQVRATCFVATSATFCVIIPYGPLLQYSGIRIFRTSKGNKNWFRKIESSRYRG